MLLCSCFSPSFHFQVPPLTLTISRLYPYFYTPTTHSFLLPCFPSFTRVKNKTKWPTAFIPTIHYWYMCIGIAIIGEPSPTWTTQPTLLTRTREPRHLHTPTTGLAMGQGLRNQEGDPPPRPTEELTSRESNRPPARSHSIDSR